MTASTTERTHYRPEIQGIRTIGALLVACFHIWGGRVSGGVDVFFVISGYLITGSLYKEMQRSQSIDVIAFWGRLAKRIAPMGYTVLALTMMAALLWMPQTLQAEFLSEVIYSSLHLENLKLMMSSVDYLARDEAPSPVQQFWALSVQVQFYAIWPFLLLGSAFVAGRLRSSWVAYAAILASVFLASLAYSIVQTSRDPAPTYFDTLARVWEFALGGILAVALPRLVIPSLLRYLAGWLGLLAVVSCGFVLPASSTFPGYVSLWPTLGAALVLVSGGHGFRFGADRLLAARPLVSLGNISFSFYLWHWPIMIFAMLVSGQTQLDLASGLAVIVIAGFAAFCANRWIEQPIQDSKVGKARAWHLHAIAAGCAVPVLGVALFWMLTLNGMADQNSHVSIAEYQRIPLRPPIALAGRDVPQVYPDRCNQEQHMAELIACTYGNALSPKKTIALVGGSHSTHWFPALEALARENDWRLVITTKHGCPFTTGDQEHASCRQWNEALVKHLLVLRPDAVFTTSTRRNPMRGRPSPEGGVNGVEHVPSGYLEQWSRLAENGLTVIAIRDTPWMNVRVPACLEGAPSKGINCGRMRREIIDEVDPVSKLDQKPSNVEFIDLTDQFCDESLCPPVKNNIIIYRDGNHLTATYARSLSSILREEMRRVRPDLFPTEVQQGPVQQKNAEAG